MRYRVLRPARTRLRPSPACASTRPARQTARARRRRGPLQRMTSGNAGSSSASASGLAGARVRRNGACAPGIESADQRVAARLPRREREAAVGPGAADVQRDQPQGREEEERGQREHGEDIRLAHLLDAHGALVHLLGRRQHRVRHCRAGPPSRSAGRRAGRSRRPGTARRQRPTSRPVAVTGSRPSTPGDAAAAAG